MRRFFFVLMLLFFKTGVAADLSGKIEKLDWEGLEVVWLKDQRFPSYSMIFYFADGALSDKKGSKGVTSMMFSLLDSGTRRFNRAQLNDNLEYYGVSRRTSVFHEYSSYMVSGLIKDIVPTMKKICHIFDDAIFPKEELKKEKRKATHGLLNLVASPSNLANRVFREISLKGTPFEYPAEGKMKDIKGWSQKKLRKKLVYFKEKVKKRLYIVGPSNILKVKKIINEECGFKGQENKFERNVSYPPKKTNSHPEIYLVTIPNANQAQVRLGRFLNQGEYESEELQSLASSFMGGGFTSRLMREVRVKRGLTYGISSFISRQKDYGRSGIFTSTQNSTVNQLLLVVKETVENAALGEFELKELERTKGRLSGGHYFRFENLEDYLFQLLFYDHIQRPYQELFKFGERVETFSKNEVIQSIGDIFGWKKQVIVVLGDKNLYKPLKKLGKVKKMRYKKFL